MPISRRALLLAGGACAAASLARALDRDTRKAARAVVDELLAKDPIPALSIAVMGGNELLWAEAFGKVDLELDVPATVNHRFRLGSVSKVITQVVEHPGGERHVQVGGRRVVSHAHGRGAVRRDTPGAGQAPEAGAGRVVGDHPSYPCRAQPVQSRQDASAPPAAADRSFASQGGADHLPMGRDHRVRVVSPFFYGYPYFYGDYGYYDSSCWQNQRMRTPNGWRWRRVDVCTY